MSEEIQSNGLHKNQNDEDSAASNEIVDSSDELLMDNRIIENPALQELDPSSVYMQIYERRFAEEGEMPKLQSSSNVVVPTSLDSGYFILENIRNFQKVLNADQSKISLSELAEYAAKFRNVMVDKAKQDKRFLPAFTAAIEDVFHGEKSSTIRFSNRLTAGDALLNVTKDMVVEGRETKDYFRIFIEAASRTFSLAGSKLETAIGNSKYATAQYALENESSTNDPRERYRNAKQLLENRTYNWLRLPGVLNPIPYDRLHKWNMYVFTDTDEPNEFATIISSISDKENSENLLIKDKRILTLGPGNGQDEKLFIERGAKSVDMIEGSKFMLKRLRKQRAQMSDDEAKKFIIPSEPRDMIQEMKRMNDENVKKHDTIYAFSAVHYYDDETLLYFLSLLRKRLHSNGHLAISVKAPGAILDSDDAGITLIEESSKDEDISKRKLIETLRSRMRLNLDGQTRVFRDQQALEDLLSTFFHVKLIFARNVLNYETLRGENQKFYEFICTPKTDLQITIPSALKNCTK